VRQYVKTHVDGHLKISGPQVLLFDVHGGLKIMNTKQVKGVPPCHEHKIPKEEQKPCSIRGDLILFIISMKWMQASGNVTGKPAHTVPMDAAEY
jgi:hypothetical protein